MTRILGIDPGSRCTGFGVLDSDGLEHRYVTSGCIRVSGDTLAERLRVIHTGLSELLDAHAPDAVAVEQVFMHRNAASALKLGQARGAAVLSAAMRGLPVHEYTPTQIKQAITGRGHAHKEQINHMVRVLLHLDAAPQEDAADALAAALCHSHFDATLRHLPQSLGVRGGRLR